MISLNCNSTTKCYIKYLSMLFPLQMLKLHMQYFRGGQMESGFGLRSEIFGYSLRMN